MRCECGRPLKLGLVYCLGSYHLLIDVIFYFNFSQTNEYFAPELCYNLMHFHNLHRGVAFNADIQSTKESNNYLTFVCFFCLKINKTNAE